MNRIALFGQWGVENLQQFGKSGVLLFRVFCQPPDLRKNFPLVVQQIYAEGVLSLLIIIVSSLFIGMVLALQGYHTLAKFALRNSWGPWSH